MVVFLVDFALISANYHTEMISFIKFFSCHSFFPAAAQTGRGIMFYAASLNCFEF